MTAVAAITAITVPLETMVSRAAHAARAAFDFDEITHGVDETHHVAPGYRADVLVRWGDPVLPDAPEFDPRGQSADAQAMQFGYNNDYIGYAPLPIGSGEFRPRAALREPRVHQRRGDVLGHRAPDKIDFPDMTAELVDIEMAAHGGTVIQVEKVDGHGVRRQTVRATAGLRPTPACACPAWPAGG